MNLVSMQAFAGAANQEFELAMGPSAVTVTLVEVKPLKPQPFPGMLREPFSLLFKSQSPVILPQKTYRMRNGAVGEIDLFLVPVAREGAAVVYQAVFS